MTSKSSIQETNDLPKFILKEKAVLLFFQWSSEEEERKQHPESNSDLCKCWAMCPDWLDFCYAMRYHAQFRTWITDSDFNLCINVFCKTSFKHLNEGKWCRATLKAREFPAPLPVNYKHLLTLRLKTTGMKCNRRLQLKSNRRFSFVIGCHLKKACLS